MRDEDSALASLYESQPRHSRDLFVSHEARDPIFMSLYGFSNRCTLRLGTITRTTHWLSPFADRASLRNPGLRCTRRPGWKSGSLPLSNSSISFEMRMLHQSWPHIAQKSVSMSRSSS